MRSYFYILLILSTISFSACKELVEERLDKESVTLLAPPDSLVSQNFSVTFWWEEIEGADYYHLQIVTPRFDSLIAFSADTNVVGDRFVANLSPGVYQWRLRAENSAYQTDYVFRTFTVDTTADIANSTIQLVYPEDLTYLNVTNFYLDWNSISSSDNYNLQVYESVNGTTNPDFTGNNVYDKNVSVDSFEVTLSEGTYSWRVRAQNSISNSPYSSRVFVVDTTAPVAPVLQLPLNNAVVVDSAVLEWTRVANAFADSVFIYEDTLASVIANTIYTQSSSLVFTGDTITSYFWKVKSIDKANNVSEFSSLRKFSFQ